MTTPETDRTDRIARQAARLLAMGEASNVHAAIRQAAEVCGDGEAPLPSTHRVRQHARAMAMQAMGSQGYEQSIREMWAAAEELMTSLEMLIPGSETLLMGRAAEGLVDGGLVVHLRLVCSAGRKEIDTVLEEDLEIAQRAWRTVDARVGRVNQVAFSDGQFEYVLTRVPSTLHVPADADLFKGERIASLDLAALRCRLRGD